MDNESNDRLGEAWDAHRAHLINVAFRLLGDVGSAEDAVQEAYSRLLKSTPGEIQDDRGWLTVVTSRICLDQLRSARSRLDRPMPAEGFDVAGDIAGPGIDPADRVTLDDRVGSALLVVLQRLTPAERVVFVMHDVFQIPFETISETVGRPASTCRQLASRARQRIGAVADQREIGIQPASDREVAEAFIEACAGGDLGGLLAVLDPDVSGDGTFGPDVPDLAPAIGATAVAHRTIAFLGHGATLVSHPLTAQPTLLAFINRRLLAVIELTIADGTITHLHADGRPASLAKTVTALAAISAPG
jgi:RNA polymerase sigma-70 factor (ECF subfamily)